MVVDPRPVIVCRIAAPTDEATNCPMIAKLDQQDHRHHVLLGLAADDGMRDGRAEFRAKHRAADEADEAQRADDETLPVTGDRERGGDNEQG